MARTIKHPVIIITKVEQKAALQRYASWQSKKSKMGAGLRRVGATELHTIRPGCSILLTPKEKAEANLLPVWPSDSDAHPAVPAVLFRISDGASQSPLDDHSEFVAGQFRTMPLIEPPPAPSAMYPVFHSFVGTHLNRDLIASPFISTSSS